MDRLANIDIYNADGTPAGTIRAAVRYVGTTLTTELGGVTREVRGDPDAGRFYNLRLAAGERLQEPS